jgi:glycosyltransferase involved in cell wall biosynthesis
MKILFVAQFVGRGGVEMVIRNRWLAMRDAHHVSAVFLYGEPAHADPVADEVLVTTDRSAIEARARAADVVCVIDTPQVFAAVDAAHRPVVVEVHTAYEHQRRYLRRPLPVRTARVFAPTRAFANVVERELDNQHSVDVVSNPIDPALFEPDLEPRVDGARRVMWTGRFDRLKNWRAAIEVFAIANRRCAALELSMYGYRGEPVAGALSEAGVLGATRIWPPVARTAMPAQHRACARTGGVHLSTSSGESFGMAVAEAMAAGVPCVVPPLPALEEITGGEAAYFTTTAEAAAAIERLLDDPTHRTAMTRALRERARAFHPAATMPALIRTLETCR